MHYCLHIGQFDKKERNHVSSVRCVRAIGGLRSVVVSVVVDSQPILLLIGCLHDEANVKPT